MKTSLPTTPTNQLLTTRSGLTPEIGENMEILPRDFEALPGRDGSNVPLDPVELTSRDICRDELRQGLKNRLPYLHSPPGRFTSRAGMHRRFDQSIEQIQSWNNEMEVFSDRQFRSATQLVGFEKIPHDSPVRRRTERIMRELLGNLCDFPAEPLNPPHSLQLVAQPDARRIDNVYGGYLTRQVDRFADRVVQHFDRLQERGIFGRAQYVGPKRDRHCQFSTFFSRAVCHRFHEQKDEDVTEDRDANRRTTRVNRLLEGGTTFQHVLAGYQLRDVKCRRLDCWDMPVPARIRELMRSVPSFLRQYTFVTDGVQRNKIEMTRDVKDFDWSYSDERVNTEPIIRPDPFLSIGPYVVGYWNDSEQLWPMHFDWSSMARLRRSAQRMLNNVRELIRG